MKKIALAFAVVAGFGLAGMGMDRAEAASPFGFHFSRGGIHIDVGRVHHGGHYSRGNTYYRGHSYSPYRGGHRGHYDWHDTTHYDYHPPQILRHGNHYDYVPGHYDLHRSGHYDYHRGSHGHYRHR